MNRFFLARGLLIAAMTLGAVFGVPPAHAQEARTVTDALGRDVTIETPPQRVVGMSASIIEMLLALDITPPGVTLGIENPAVANLPTFGTGYQPDLEALAALEPDLIIANAQLQAQLIDQLEVIAPTFFVMTMTAADVPANIRLIGQVTWHETNADYLARSYDDFLALVDNLAVGENGPSVLIVVGTLQQPNFGKSATYLGDMLRRLGGVKVADGEPDDGPFPGYAQLSIESILEADPDLIFTVTRGGPGAIPIPEDMAADATWSALSAVQAGTVYELDNRLFLEAPGPRFTEALLQLYALFFGGTTGE